MQFPPILYQFLLLLASRILLSTEINVKEIKFQINQTSWLIQLSGNKQFFFSISYQNTTIKIQLIDKESSPTCGIFPENSDYIT